MSRGFGIIGCGMIAHFHAQALAAIPGARLIGCHARRPEQTQEFADKRSCLPFESLESLLADSSIDVVTICTPSGAHCEPAVQAAEAGKHVLVEKPLEITLERCDRIIAACQANGVALGTIFPSRFHACWQQLRGAVAAGRFGRIALANAYIKWYRTQDYYDSGRWRGTWEWDGGGALMNQGIHTIDLLQWLMGPVNRLSAQVATLAHERIEVEDTAVACLQFENHALGTIEATTASYPGMLKRIEIHGDRGSAIVEEEQILHWQFAEPWPGDEAIKARSRGASTSGGGASDPAAIGFQAHQRQFEDFLAALDRGQNPEIDGREGRKSVEIVLGIYRAARSQQWETLVN